MQTQQATLFDIQEVPEALAPYVDSEALAAALAAPYMALDIETETRWPGIGPEKDYGLSYAADVRVIALAWPDQSKKPHTSATVLVGPFSPEVLEALTRRFSEARVIAAHNAVFDIRGMSKLTGGRVPAAVWDTQVMARLLHPQAQSHYGLLHVAKALGVPFTQQQEQMKGERGQLHKLSAKQVIEYAIDDALVTLKVYETQQQFIQDSSLYTLAEIECEAVRVYCQMAARGVRLNTGYVQQRIAELDTLVKAAGARLKQAGLHNPGSPQQRAKFIYEKQGIPKPDGEDRDFYTKGGSLATGADVIEALIERHPDHAGKLTDLAVYLDADRMLATLHSLLEHAALDSRVHSLVSINTQAGRRSASHPQVQNWKMSSLSDDPVGNLAGVVCGDEGFTLVEIDYSNAENWIAAMLSGDDNFAAACAAEDFHSAMAAQYFKEEWDTADKDNRKHLRFMGKRVTFGTAYGMGAAKLARSLGIEKSEAEHILRTRDKAFPYVAATKKLAMSKASSEGYITLWTGRCVQVDKNQVYVAWNYLCQGGVAEMTKRAIVSIAQAFEERGWRSRVALDMHDAVVLEVAHEEWSEAIPLASAIMQSVIPAEMNARTSPPVRWIAQPNLEENAKKWGKGQQHFDLLSVETNDMQTGATEAKSDQLDAWYQTGVNAFQLGIQSQDFLAQLAKDGKHPSKAEREAYERGYADAGREDEFEPEQNHSAATQYRIAFEDMGFVGEVKAGSRQSWLDYLSKLWDAIDAEFSEVYETQLPQVVGSEVTISNPVKVTLENWAKVPLAWAGFAQSGVDTQELIGYSAQELQEEATRRQGWIATLTQRCEMVAGLISKVWAGGVA